MVSVKTDHHPMGATAQGSIDTCPTAFSHNAVCAPQGLGSALTENLPRRSLILMIITMLAGVTLMLGSSALWLVLPITFIFFGLRHLMMQRLGGATGYVAGALVEIIEASVLVIMVLVLSMEGV